MFQALGLITFAAIFALCIIIIPTAIENSKDRKILKNLSESRAQS